MTTLEVILPGFASEYRLWETAEAEDAGEREDVIGTLSALWGRDGAIILEDGLPLMRFGGGAWRAWSRRDAVPVFSR